MNREKKEQLVLALRELRIMTIMLERVFPEEYREVFGKPHEIFERPVETLSLSIRGRSGLGKVHIRTIGQLVTWNDLPGGDKSLRRVLNFGEISLREVKRKLEELGLRLNMTETEIREWNPPPRSKTPLVP